MSSGFVRGVAVGSVTASLLTALFLATVFSTVSFSSSRSTVPLVEPVEKTTAAQRTKNSEIEEKTRATCPPCETQQQQQSTSPTITCEEKKNPTTTTTTLISTTTSPSTALSSASTVSSTSLSSSPISLCSKDIFNGLPVFIMHPYTMRGFKDHEQLLHPPFLNLTLAMRAARSDFRMLDIGTGSGHTLLDIQAAFPYSRLVGTNHLDYEKGASVSQAFNDVDLIGVARNFRIPLHCDSLGRPLLPRITFLDINSPHLDIVFPNRSFDFMISLLALNGPSKTVKHPYLSTLVEKLAPGGLAILHAGDAMFAPEFMAEFGNYSAVGALTTTRNNRTLSVMMFVKMSPFLHLWDHGDKFYFVNCVIKVCPPSFQPTAEVPDCILPPNTKLRGLDFLVEKNTHVWEVVRWSLNDFIENLKALK